MKHPLEEIPGVGPRIAGVMEKLGIRQVSDLVGRDRRNCTAGSVGSKDLRRIAVPCMSGERRSIMLSTGAGSGKIKMVVLERQTLSAAKRRRNQ